MRNIVSAQRHFVARRARSDDLHLGHFDDGAMKIPPRLRHSARTRTFRHASYLQAVFLVHGETREFFR